MDVEVADRGMELIMELNNSYRELHQMKTKLDEQEKKIRASVRIEYEELVRELSSKLVEKSHLHEQRKAQIYADLLTDLSFVRNEAMKKVNAANAASFLHQVDEGQSVFAGKMRNMKMENVQLRKFLEKSKALSKIKEISLRSYPNNKKYENFRGNVD